MFGTRTEKSFEQCLEVCRDICFDMYIRLIKLSIVPYAKIS